MKWVAFFLICFLAFGAFFIISNNNLAIRNFEDFAVFYNSYYAWMSNLFYHARSVTGYAIRFDWLPNKIVNSSIDD